MSSAPALTQALLHAEQLPLRIAIVGGGIAGLTAALTIQRSQAEGANVELRIFEQAHEFGEIGAGVALGPNAQAALALIGCANELEKVASTPGLDPDLWYEFKIAKRDHPAAGNSIVTIRGKNASKGGVHRADLIQQLTGRLKNLEKIARFNHSCTGYTSSAKGVTLHFENQPDQCVDVVIASDGVKSRIRRALYEQAGLDVEKQAAIYSEWVAWRALIPRAAFDAAMGRQASLRQMLLGQGRHIVILPVRNGEMLSTVAFVQDSEHKKLGIHTGPWSEARPKQELLDDFASFDEPALALLQAFEKPTVWGIFVAPELKTTTADRVALVGDAGRAMTPHQGAGAGQAIEDALFLSTLLCASAVTEAPRAARPKQIAAALEIYDRVRHSRGRDIQRTSREAGLLYEFCGVNGEGDDPDKIAAALEGRMEWIWTWDIEAELEKLSSLCQIHDIFR